MGWLTNSSRRQLRDQPLGVTDEKVQQLLQRIDDMPCYVNANLGEDLDRLLRLRDKALICTAWLFFKRGSEVLRLRLRDVYADTEQLYVTFRIAKKVRRFRQCTACSVRNGVANRHCRLCGADLAQAPVAAAQASDTVKTKLKTMRSRFAAVIVQWLDVFQRRISSSPDAYIYPALRVRFHVASWTLEKPMTVQNFDRILQRLDPALTSCHFRYGGVEKHLLLGYTPYELKEIGDWETSVMPEIYARRKGLTSAQRRWSSDFR